MARAADKYRRTFEQLDEVASKFWPPELSRSEADLSVLPILLKTQDQFISILSIQTSDLEDLFRIIEASNLPANLFLKHLAILADFGGELLQRVSREFRKIFADGTLQYHWQEEKQPRLYTFRSMPHQVLNNKSLHIDGRHLTESYSLDDLKTDAITLLLFGSAQDRVDAQIPDDLRKCQIGHYLGKPRELAEFIKQRYLWVSRITGGAKANDLGQLAQKCVVGYIKDHLNSPNIEIIFGGRLPNVTHTDASTGRATAFDLVVTNGMKYAAVEVSFQVTTNSTIERKAGQAKSRFQQINRSGHKIAYVIDGAGNFQRETAIRTMLAHSHCSVAFSHSELTLLCEFLREFLEND
ncbi:MAG TPA: restriction endonuclease [bacterium]|nr:restriction endonuclease [bacterium]